MGQVTGFVPPSLILTATDRLVASNADGGLSPLAAHVILLGEAAGRNLGPLTNVVVLGWNSLRGGLANAGQDGSQVLGGLNLTALTNAFAPAGDGPIHVIGSNNFPLQQNGIGNAVIIGSRVGSVMPAGGSDISNSVFIGTDVLRYQRVLAANGGNGYQRTVAIGSRVLQGSAAVVTDGGGAVAPDCVVIGDRAMQNTGSINLGIPGAVAAFNVVIGAQAGLNLARDQNATAINNVLIGNQCLSGQVNVTNGVFIGAGVTAAGGATSQFVLIGNGVSGSAQANTTGNTVIGSLASLSGVGSYNILIGAECNAAAQLANNSSGQLLIETNPGCLIYGRFATAAGNPGGGIIIGHSVAANRDIPGLNILKLINGARDAGLTAPVGGGFFYSVGGVVHWVTSGNLDFNLVQGGLGNFTFATLPAAPPQGSKAYITDGAAAPAFAAAAAGGGALYTPVYFDGAAWLNG